MTRQPGFTCQAAFALKPWGNDLDGLPTAGRPLSAQDLTGLHGAMLIPATCRPPRKSPAYMLWLGLQSRLHTRRRLPAYMLWSGLQSVLHMNRKRLPC